MRGQKIGFVVSLSAVLVLLSCSTAIVKDNSIDAFASSDLTLVSSCLSTSGPTISMSSGVDSCQFTVGDIVSGAWTLVVPSPKNAKNIVGGTIDVYYKDKHKAYPVDGWANQVYFRDFLQLQHWTKDYDEGVVSALVTISWVDNEGVNQLSKFRGLAVLVVTARGYDRMPIGSHNNAWGTTCKVQYSTAGRSAVECR